MNPSPLSTAKAFCFPPTWLTECWLWLWDGLQSISSTRCDVLAFSLAMVLLGQLRIQELLTFLKELLAGNTACLESTLGKKIYHLDSTRHFLCVTPFIFLQQCPTYCNCDVSGQVHVFSQEVQGRVDFLPGISQYLLIGITTKTTMTANF